MESSELKGILASGVLVIVVAFSFLSFSSSGAFSRASVLAINTPAAPALLCDRLNQNGTVGKPFTFTALGGIAPYTWFEADKPVSTDKSYSRCTSGF